MATFNLASGLLSCAVLAVLLLLAAVAAVRARRALSGLRARNHELEASLVALRRELEGNCVALAHDRRRQRHLERNFALLSQRLIGVEARADAPAFDRAIDSARRGADTDKLAQVFGLSRGEADLIARLHGRRRRA
jgi:hypothetical protein